LTFRLAFCNASTNQLRSDSEENGLLSGETRAKSGKSSCSHACNNSRDFERLGTPLRNLFVINSLALVKGLRDQLSRL
jgi:hypothetical protein